MAKTTITRLIDDLDRGDADETVKFGLDGVQYEIDLSADNAAKLRDLLAPYVSAGSRLTRGPAGGRRRGGGPVVDRELNRRIREWARGQGSKISDRGRIPEDIVKQYHASQGR
jgi:hypothetical protein